MNITFNEIVIIESLSPDERNRTGTAVYESLLADDRLPIRVTLYKPQTAAELFSVLDALALKAEAGGWVPLIHFDMHGVAARDAVQLGSGERVKWDDIAAPLRHLNIAIRNSLTVVLGVCSGAWMTTAAANSPFEPAPFAWLVGPDRAVVDFFLPHGFKAFYGELLNSGDFAKAVMQLRQRTLPEYTALDTATLFRRSRSVFEKTQVRGSRLKERVKRAFKKTRHATVREFGSNNKARQALAQRMLDMSRWPDYYRRFIMADRFPENEARFPTLDA